MAQKKNKTASETYQRMTQIEHVLLRPDSYIGSAVSQEETQWIHDGEGMVQKTISFVPGLFKIFDEILVNAADNKVRDSRMDLLKIEVRPEENFVRVWNNGEGVPIEIHEKENIYIPELIFGYLLTSSNFDDEEKKMTGGRNGYGAKLANIYSTKFIIETADGKQSYRQVFKDNMTKREEPEIKTVKSKGSWTCVTFFPDLMRFGMTHLDDTIVSIMRKRTYDLAGVLGHTVKVYFNDQLLSVKTFQDYVSLYIGSEDAGPNRVHLKASKRWELVVALSEGEFSQVSFVNSICTSQGGSHVNYIVDQLCKGLTERLQKKMKTSTLKNFQIKTNIRLFLSCLIENPSFGSQTKELMTTRVSDFGSKCALSEDFLDKVAKCGILDQLIHLAQAKQNDQMKKTDGSKISKISVPKLEDAVGAGTKNSKNCTLVLTEGDSAKALAVSGISMVGRDTYGVFPLRGKLLNVREASSSQITGNKEIQYLKQILGLRHGKDYDDTGSLRYGHIMIMTDQDHDGSHIKGLIINFLHHFHPNLIKVESFLQEFITPIMKVTKGNREKSFYTIPEYEAWKEAEGPGVKKWTIKYYKGLGTSTSKEAREYFSNISFHKKDFLYQGPEDDEVLDLAFAKKRANDRKEWLASYQEGTYLDHQCSTITYTDFVNKELVLFSRADLERSIPNLMDGLKVTQRKILYACLRKELNKEMKVSELVGYVSQHSAYHHGEQSLASTLVSMAQNFVGSNNINLLVPAGQFGTRLQGGKDSASPRYIHTRLTPITRLIFHKDDDDLLDYLDDDGQSIQPRWYVPVIPLILVNGAEGIGTGWSTNLPNYNPLDIIDNLLKMINGEEVTMMHPWYKGFKGSIEIAEDRPSGQSYLVSGQFNENEEENIEILDLPLKRWTEDYKEFLKELRNPPDNQSPSVIYDYEDLSTDTGVNFIITVNEEQKETIRQKGILETFKLTSRIATTNMVLFTEEEKIHKFKSALEILSAFFHVRMGYYHKRKAALIHKAEVTMKKLDNKACFILAIVKNELVISRKKNEVIQSLEEMGFDRLPPASKKAHQDRHDEPQSEEVVDEAANFDYLLNMNLVNLTDEKVEELMKASEEQKAEVSRLQNETPEAMWKQDLLALREAYVKFRDEWILEVQVSDERVRQLRKRKPARMPRGGRAGGSRGRGAGRGASSSAPQVENGAPSARGGRSGRGRGRGRGQRTIPTISESSGTTEASTVPGLVVGEKRKKKDSEEDDESVIPSPRKAPKRGAARTKTVVVLDSSEDSEQGEDSEKAEDSDSDFEDSDDSPSDSE